MTAAAPAASPAPPQVLLAHHLRQLKLPTFLREYEKVAAEAAREGLDHVRFLLRLAELELIDRERRMVERRIRAAHFSAVKSFDTFDFTAIPSLNKPLTLELARCEYLIARDNVIALGNSGTGKTHACLALGLAACQRGFPVSFFTAAGLVHQLMEARDERRLLKLQAQLAAVKLLIVDELGYVPLSQTGAELLFEIFSQRHERGSTIVTSNLPFEEWTSVFGNQRLTGALLDRLTHHVHILELNGESYEQSELRPLRRLGSHIAGRRRIAAHLGNRVSAQSENPRRRAPALPFDEDKPSNRCVNLHREHPRPSLFESDFEKVRPRKWPGFTPPRATALCRRSVAYYCTAAYISTDNLSSAAYQSYTAANLSGDSTAVPKKRKLKRECQYPCDGGGRLHRLNSGACAA